MVHSGRWSWTRLFWDRIVLRYRWRKDKLNPCLQGGGAVSFHDIKNNLLAHIVSFQQFTMVIFSGRESWNQCYTGKKKLWWMTSHFWMMSNQTAPKPNLPIQIIISSLEKNLKKKTNIRESGKRHLQRLALALISTVLGNVSKQGFLRWCTL